MRTEPYAKQELALIYTILVAQVAVLTSIAYWAFATDGVYKVELYEGYLHPMIVLSLTLVAVALIAYQVYSFITLLIHDRHLRSKL